MSTDLQNYLEYVKTTLGVTNLVLPEAREVATTYKAVFFCAENLPANDLSLLQKILEALPLPLEKIGLLQGTLGELVESLSFTEIHGPLFCFSPEAASFLKHNYPDLLCLELPSLEKMHSSTDLKRHAWGTLKQAFKIKAPRPTT